MKNVIILLVVILLTSCQETKTDNETIISLNPYLIGNWSGEGRFLNTDFDKDIGEFFIEVKIKESFEISGTVGDAKLTHVSISKAKHGFDIKGILSTKIKKNAKVKKDHFIILLVLPEKDRKNANSSEANFHLKSNYTFDFDMRVGGVNLIKKIENEVNTH